MVIGVGWRRIRFQNLGLITVLPISINTVAHSMHQGFANGTVNTHRHEHRSIVTTRPSGLGAEDFVFAAGAPGM